ncbi:MAG TPA: TIGR02594 family protein [Hyphomicrobium sp.]|nr:TIGR02594 family protein [Hyphomicrobium sp.]
MRWMDIAWEQEGAGVEEIGGPQAHKSIIAYFHQIGRADITSDEVPWCAAFYFWCLQKAGVDISSIDPKKRLLAISAGNLGTCISGPRVGCACVFPRRDKSGRIIGHHVGFVTGWTASVITLLGGNQANKVREADFKRTADMMFVWPPPPATAADMAAEGSRTVAASNRQIKDGAKGAAVQTAPIPTPDAAVFSGASDAHSASAPFPDPSTIAGKASQSQGWFSTFESFALFAWGKWPWIAGALALYWLARMAWDAFQIRRARIEDHNTGKTLAVEPGADAPSEATAWASEAPQEGEGWQ